MGNSPKSYVFSVKSLNKDALEPALLTLEQL